MKLWWGKEFLDRGEHLEVRGGSLYCPSTGEHTGNACFIFSGEAGYGKKFRFCPMCGVNLSETVPGEGMDITYKCEECGLVIIKAGADPTPPMGWEYCEAIDDTWYWLCPKCK